MSAFVDAQEDAWQALFQSLVQQRSVFEEEHRVVDLVANRIAELGLEVIRVLHDPERLEALAHAQRPISRVPGRSSLVTRLAGRRGGRSLLFNVHLDVVPEGDPSTWTYAPFGGEIDRDRGVIYGRGAMDDKAGVTIALAVLETLTYAVEPLDGDVIFHFVLEDEITGNGTLLCLDAGHRADAGVIIDGTRPDRAVDRHAGQLQFDVLIVGRPASVSVSHIGVNAAEMLARLLGRLVDRVGTLNASRVEPWTRFPSPFQLVVQRLESQGAPLTVPEQAYATCYMTFPPPATVSQMQQLLLEETEAFARERALPTAPVLTWSGFVAEPVSTSAAALAALLARCAEAEGYGAVDVGPSTGTSDLRHFADAGIPCLLYGPGNGFKPHRADEYYELADLPRMVRLFVHLAREWCTRDGQ